MQIAQSFYCAVFFDPSDRLRVVQIRVIMLHDPMRRRIKQEKYRKDQKDPP